MHIYTAYSLRHKHKKRSCWLVCTRNATPPKRYIMKKEKKTGHFETLKNVIYAVKVIKQCAPWFITFQVLAMIGNWFFTGFIQEILFLRIV